MEEIDIIKAKKFWDERADKVREIGNLNLIVLEENSVFSVYRDLTEKRHLFRIVKIKNGDTILDLGCGIGRWAFEFARRAERVVAIDFAEKLIETAKEEAAKQCIFNIEFICGAITEFISEEKFDIIFLGGVLNYLNDSDLKRVLNNLNRMLKKEGIIASRESLSSGRRFVANDEFNDKLEANYSAVYRTPREYTEFFKELGFRVSYSKKTYPYPLLFKIGKRFLPSRLLLGLMKLQAYIDSFLLLFEKAYYPLIKSRVRIYQAFFVFRKDSAV